MQVYEDGNAALEKCIDELHHKAMIVADAYWDFVNAKEKTTSGWESKSSLQLSCYRRGNHIEIKWSGIKWYGAKTARRNIRVPIQKNKDTMIHPDAKLKPFAKDWEFDMVKETELKMQTIRRQAHHVVRAIMSIRNAKQVNRVTPIDGLSADEFNKGVSTHTHTDTDTDTVDN